MDENLINLGPPAAAAPAAPTLTDLVNAIGILAESQSAMQNSFSQYITAAGNLRSTPRSASVKARDPRMFSGKAGDLEAFLNDLEGAMHLQKSALSTDEDRYHYLSRFMSDGSPVLWATNIKRFQPDLVIDFEGLLENFRAHFGDPDIHNTYLRKLETLVQTKSAAVYGSKFREIMTHLNQTDESRMTYYRRGLKDSVKDLLVGVMAGDNPPKDLDSLMRVSITIDNRLHERALEKKNPRSSIPLSQRLTDPAPSTSRQTHIPGTESVAMEIDAIRVVTKLTAEEKQRRKDNNLCLYCGGAGHRVDNCPVKAKSGKAPVAK